MDYLEGVFKDILSNINELMEMENKDKSFYNVVKGVLKKVKEISKANGIDDIYRELIDWEEDTEEKKLMKKLLVIRDILNNKVADRHRVLVFSDDDDRLKGIVNKLQNREIDVVVSKSDVVDTIFSCDPSLVIIQNENSLNVLTILKSIREEKMLEQLPVVVISDRDYNTRLEFLKLGVVECVGNDFDVEELCLKILNFINMSSKCLKNAVYDIATGLYTKRQGEILAEYLYTMAKNEEEDITLLLIDFDNMAEINKKMGFSLGNSIIKDVISEFKKYTTKVDVAYRIAGDEFAIVFYERDIKWVKDAAEEVLKYSIELGQNYGMSVSFSAGIATRVEGDKSFQELYIRAKDALSRAKIEGKSRVVSDSESFKQSRNKNILFVDDDKIILSILKSRYKNKGYNVFTALDGTEALEILENNKIDLVVTDYFMKLMNGDELIKNIRQKDKEIAIIVLTSQKNEEYIKRALDLGADDYIIKPFSPGELDSRIKKLID
ncbi:diguanylate cyclase (GGDEF) domain-containing protein [Thermosyntropha lipolytica DSM 11003]|uniref:Stage 0 sporulation protein A homolog n=1 Tax=Thermosyntropha lipolytica DSM 11003 TaxID=1123382 RepID=A0A1M5QKB2_9FIRM|nr:response regulator [Thermosyntropha lipolytica]SHH14229.1 diguanylate cyclase (GGDEF) domain-containing protein [Thermosyntropha lipolytica DSM 11003]